MPKLVIKERKGGKTIGQEKRSKKKNGRPQGFLHNQIKRQYVNEHMFSTVDYDGALLFPVRIHFQFPARHFSFITLIT